MHSCHKHTYFTILQYVLWLVQWTDYIYTFHFLLCFVKLKEKVTIIFNNPNYISQNSISMISSILNQHIDMSTLVQVSKDTEKVDTNKWLVDTFLNMILHTSVSLLRQQRMFKLYNLYFQIQKKQMYVRFSIQLITWTVQKQAQWMLVVNWLLTRKVDHYSCCFFDISMQN